MFPQKWKIYLYSDENQNLPVANYITSFTNETEVAIMLQVINSLSKVGFSLLQTNMCKKINENIYELRKDRHRILFARIDNSFILLSAFLKKTQKTPREEIILAETRFQDYLSNKEQRSKYMRQE